MSRCLGLKPGLKLRLDERRQVLDTRVRLRREGSNALNACGCLAVIIAIGAPIACVTALVRGYVLQALFELVLGLAAIAYLVSLRQQTPQQRARTKRFWRNFWRTVRRVV